MVSEIDADKNQDEPIIDAEEIYKTGFFYRLLDTAINSLQPRFPQLQHYNSYFCFLYHIYELKDVSSSVILLNFKDLETILTDGELSDINSLELCDEISVVCSLLEKDLPLLEVLKLITKMNYAPNLSIALRILLTLPIKYCIRET
ncbi:hypothetical protein AVEN_158922-1 [Araneus ventricosus]|uniref:HAT C-terminal dimerisation domain-containing protein n=1 Tax=Araneus ventricosus TaxID=182803 RepID=A0A4Y2BBH1_ARAVE|nr:hypothetical protein AVEN_158922-1 [Araneus ventricosus]